MNTSHFTKTLIHRLKSDPILDWAATLAYYFMLSIFPLLIFILALVPYFQFDTDGLQHFITDYVPDELADVLFTTIFEVVSERQGGLLSFGILATIWSASNGINALIRAVNRSYDVEETRNFIQLRLLSIGLTISMIFVIVITLLLPVFGNLIITILDRFFFLPDETTTVLKMLRWIIGISLMSFLLMIIYRLAPNVKLTFSQVLIGSFVATIGWQFISIAFSTYISQFGNFSATYGSLGGVIVLMLWFFLSGIILVVGGQVNAVLYELHRTKRF
ncbi:YihY/virulence factor BrkB family protein [Halalkalibacter hemicellulosilyticus]|uniref:Inner membrane protein YihY n=1 Tax=Halalkalibacter hemicellulosilyticusJCM 9152 TaxID=1236971 RepID=W4QEF6_9BACI|nr:YihY/virulence factor BrkB family protein [Halalkalibacter hemicellulosilyticus]GAE30332.1 inner membrane protein YihY [Halalkalibacter hemicellulosilyticusJCM 9152]